MDNRTNMDNRVNMDDRTTRANSAKINRGFFTVGENIQHDAEFSMTMNFSLLKSALKVKDL